MLTYEKAKAILDEVQGASFAGLDTVTTPVLKGGKKNEQQGRIQKFCLGHHVMLFTNKKSSGYENKVKRHLEKAGLDPNGFVMGSLPWGQRVPDSPFIEHKGEHYLQCIFLKAGETTYLLDGLPIDKEQIIGLPEQTGSEHQGLERDKQVIVRTYKLSSILALRAMGEEIG